MRDQQEQDEMRTLAGFTLIMGAWLIVSPYVLNYATTGSRWNQLIFGIIVVILAAIRYMTPQTRWTAWLLGISSIWLIIAPFALDYIKTAAYWNEIIFGILIGAATIWNASMLMHHHTTPHAHNPAM